MTRAGWRRADGTPFDPVQHPYPRSGRGSYWGRVPPIGEQDTAYMRKPRWRHRRRASPADVRRAAFTALRRALLFTGSTAVLVGGGGMAVFGFVNRGQPMYAVTGLAGLGFVGTFLIVAFTSKG